MKVPSLIGMVHLAPLPGSSRYGGSFDQVIEHALSDASTLKEAGFRALLVENFGDAPFFPDDVPHVTVASMTRVIGEIAAATTLPVGVNVLRNDALSALAVAAATGAAYVRVNVLSGMMITDQGPIVGRAAEVARLRRQICPDVAILADVLVKHSTPPAGLTIEQAGLDTWERAGADALIVSGTGTGHAPDAEDAYRLRKTIPEARILIGSGVSPSNLAELAEIANGAIVGSHLKQDGKAENPVDSIRAREIVEAAAVVGW
jgi:membrane complex biogenesis BtpA family protein